MAGLSRYQNKRIAIYGMGMTGCSAAKTLKKLKADIFCWDDNAKVRKKIKNLYLPINKFWLSKKSFDNILISPGIDINNCKISNFLIKNLSKVITDLDLFFNLNKDKIIISITGTNGKSTTCKIIEKILKRANYKVKTVGNIGNPILSFYKKKYIFILEASSYQLQYSKLFRSRHAAILNISPDHLDRHKNIKNYIKIKSRIFFKQHNNDYSYINLNNKYSKSLINTIQKKKIKSKIVKIKKSNHYSLVKKIKNGYFKSAGNIENMIFAYKIAKNFKIKDKIIIKALNKFKGLPHRQEVIYSNGKILCVNDSKATSFDAALQSLSNYEQIYWIVGGQPKRHDHFHLKSIKSRIVKAYIIGKNVNFFKKQIKKNIPFSISYNLKKAINDIFKDIKLNTSKKKTILLSPAAASFDQFSNFENRGIYFKNLITKKFKKNKYVNF